MTRQSYLAFPTDSLSPDTFLTVEELHECLNGWARAFEQRLLTPGAVTSAEEDELDAWQDAFLEAAQAIADGTANSIANRPAWLGKVRRDAAALYARKRAIQPVLVQAEKLDILLGLTPQGYTWEQIAEMTEIINGVIDRLPLEEKEAVKLCLLDGVKRRDAADKLLVGDGTLTRLIDGARAKFAAALGEQGFYFGRKTKKVH